MARSLACPCCGSPRVAPFAEKAGYAYHCCRGCDSLFIEPAVLAAIDAGVPLVSYDTAYWREEVRAARERAWADALARVAEVFYYCRIPITRFLDVGTGPGFVLDALARHLPSRQGLFWGVERFPPPAELRSSSRHYVIGAAEQLGEKFSAGTCIEVLEHLTPRMAEQLFRSIASVSEPGAFYLFNTGSPDHVRTESPEYLDPLRRGHIVSYSMAAVARLAGPHGFRVLPSSGRNWAFGLEYRSTTDEPLASRVWTALADNLRALEDPEMGSAMRLLGRESARIYA